MWDCLSTRCHLTFPVGQLLPCWAILLPQLLVSTRPASLDEFFFFNSLVVGLLYNLIFWHCWLIFVFKLVVILLLVVGGSEAYLSTPPSWPECKWGPVSLLQNISELRACRDSERKTQYVQVCFHIYLAVKLPSVPWWERLKCSVAILLRVYCVRHFRNFIFQVMHSYCMLPNVCHSLKI